MKNIIFVFALILPLMACASSPVPENGIRLQIDGMTCEPCAETLIKKFSKEKAIESANVDWETGEGMIIQKQGQTLKDSEIEKIVDWSGFELLSIERAQN
ncbi:MAG: heavy-metal-associated domain-containing protein [Alphaproteobacteria bacterium]|nr:heavy-metal-associated domain-containing protein [Alphaproteobacteria bacterium]NCQ88322.1 heavy-metal-associated domain-containing protein [Alphaproteobacteria bacterium]NCT05146.1 heavy-metal-associated domain-containing protein [Alphaproteobacteria bacterium]